jgi:uncharacterized NAD(P)/FAD-binding protein YdhS
MPDFPIPYGLSGDEEAMRSFGASQGTVESTGHAGAVPSIVIIGGGFAGTVTAIKLLDAATDPLVIRIVEKRAELGRGLAYASRDPAHVMNGPAKLFSLYPDPPEHFVRFLARYGRDWGWRDPHAPDHTNAYAPRWVYGDYLRAELGRAITHAAPGVSLQHVAAEARDLRSDGAGVAVSLPLRPAAFSCSS